jgi:hypothetical protein
MGHGSNSGAGMEMQGKAYGDSKLAVEARSLAYLISVLIISIF